MDMTPTQLPQAAQLLQVHPQTILRWIAAGKLRANQALRRSRVSGNEGGSHGLRLRRSGLAAGGAS
jgi:excisionase family DNA binding protein